MVTGDSTAATALAEPPVDAPGTGVEAPDEPGELEARELPRAVKHELIIVANRLPVRRSSMRADGAEAWTTSPGGLVAALAPIVREREGAWIGWPGSNATNTRNAFV